MTSDQSRKHSVNFVLNYDISPFSVESQGGRATSRHPPNIVYQKYKSTVYTAKSTYSLSVQDVTTFMIKMGKQEYCGHLTIIT